MECSVCKEAMRASAPYCRKCDRKVRWLKNEFGINRSDGKELVSWYFRHRRIPGDVSIRMIARLHKRAPIEIGAFAETNGIGIDFGFRTANYVPHIWLENLAKFHTMLLEHEGRPIPGIRMCKVPECQYLAADNLLICDMHELLIRGYMEATVPLLQRRRAFREYHAALEEVAGREWVNVSLCARALLCSEEEIRHFMQTGRLTPNYRRQRDTIPTSEIWRLTGVWLTHMYEVATGQTRVIHLPYAKPKPRRTAQSRADGVTIIR